MISTVQDVADAGLKSSLNANLYLHSVDGHADDDEQNVYANDGKDKNSNSPDSGDFGCALKPQSCQWPDIHLIRSPGSLIPQGFQGFACIWSRFVVGVVIFYSRA